MKGKIGVQKGEKRGTYNTPGTKLVRIRLDIYSELEKEDGKTFSEKVKNILDKINKREMLKWVQELQ